MCAPGSEGSEERQKTETILWRAAGGCFILLERKLNEHGPNEHFFGGEVYSYVYTRGTKANMTMIEEPRVRHTNLAAYPRYRPVGGSC